VVILHADWATNRPCFEVSSPCCCSCLQFFHPGVSVSPEATRTTVEHRYNLFCSSEYEASIPNRTPTSIIPVVFWISSRGLLHSFRLFHFGVTCEEFVGGAQKAKFKWLRRQHAPRILGWIPYEHEHRGHTQESMGWRITWTT